MDKNIEADPGFAGFTPIGRGGNPGVSLVPVGELRSPGAKWNTFSAFPPPVNLNIAREYCLLDYILGPFRLRLLADNTVALVGWGNVSYGIKQPTRDLVSQKLKF